MLVRTKKRWFRSVCLFVQSAIKWGEWGFVLTGLYRRSGPMGVAECLGVICRCHLGGWRAGYSVGNGRQQLMAWSHFYRCSPLKRPQSTAFLHADPGRRKCSPSPCSIPKPVINELGPYSIQWRSLSWKKTRRISRVRQHISGVESGIGWGQGNHYSPTLSVNGKVFLQHIGLFARSHDPKNVMTRD